MTLLATAPPSAQANSSHLLAPNQPALPFRSAARVNHALSAPLERRLLGWLASRTPRLVTSDHLTALGLAGQLAAALLYALSREHPGLLRAVPVCLAVNWLGDSLDGTLARVRHQQRPRFGFYVDHVVDILGSIALLCGLARSGLLHPGTAMAMLLGFLTLAAESYLATYTLGTFQLSQGFFGPTELRVLLAVGTLRAARTPYAHLFGRRWLLFDLGGLAAAACMSLVALRTVARHTRQLYRAEPLPQRALVSHNTSTP